VPSGGDDRVLVGRHLLDRELGPVARIAWLRSRRAEEAVLDRHLIGREQLGQLDRVALVDIGVARGLDHDRHARLAAAMEQRHLLLERALARIFVIDGLRHLEDVIMIVGVAGRVLLDGHRGQARQRAQLGDELRGRDARRFITAVARGGDRRDHEQAQRASHAGETLPYNAAGQPWQLPTS